MEICKDCVKQDVCKFKKDIDRWIEKGFFYGNVTVPKPLEVDIFCKLKREPDKPPMNWITSSDTTYAYPEQWTYTTVTCN